MHRAVRTQVDDKFDEYSNLAATDASDGAEWTDPIGQYIVENKDTARQEFLKDTDTNSILKRFGIPQLTKQPLFDDMDFDQDLQAALGIVQAADRLYDNLPESLKEKYPSRYAIHEGLFTGQFQKDVEEANNPTPPEPPKPPETPVNP